MDHTLHLMNFLFFFLSVFLTQNSFVLCFSFFLAPQNPSQKEDRKQGSLTFFCNFYCAASSDLVNNKSVTDAGSLSIFFPIIFLFFLIVCFNNNNINSDELFEFYYSILFCEISFSVNFYINKKNYIKRAPFTINNVAPLFFLSLITEPNVQTFN